MIEKNYEQYISGEITEKEYITRIKPIDEAIDKLEMSTLLDTLVLKENLEPTLYFYQDIPDRKEYNNLRRAK